MYFLAQKTINNFLQVIAAAFANKWFQLERSGSNCSKVKLMNNFGFTHLNSIQDIMIMVTYIGHDVDVDGLFFAYGINHTNNVPISRHQRAILWANAVGKNIKFILFPIFL